jgi:hypothetical protein
MPSADNGPAPGPAELPTPSPPTDRAALLAFLENQARLALAEVLGGCPQTEAVITEAGGLMSGSHPVSPRPRNCGGGLRPGPGTAPRHLFC